MLPAEWVDQRQQCLHVRHNIYLQLWVAAMASNKCDKQMVGRARVCNKECNKTNNKSRRGSARHANLDERGEDSGLGAEDDHAVLEQQARHEREHVVRGQQQKEIPRGQLALLV